MCVALKRRAIVRLTLDSTTLVEISLFGATSRPEIKVSLCGSRLFSGDVYDDVFKTVESQRVSQRHPGYRLDAFGPSGTQCRI